MDDDERPRADQVWDTQQRHETPTERLDRNWEDLLQELRVVQTGVQLLTGFLLTLPFQPRFDALSTSQRTIYLVTVGASVAATGFLIAPVSLHRVLFRRHARRVIVRTAHRLAVTGLALLGVAVVGVVSLVFTALLGAAAGWVASAFAVLLLTALWVVLPLELRSHLEPLDPGEDSERTVRRRAPRL